jgi:hypothetical protein
MFLIKEATCVRELNGTEQTFNFTVARNMKNGDWFIESRYFPREILEDQRLEGVRVYVTLAGIKLFSMLDVAKRLPELKEAVDGMIKAFGSDLVTFQESN